MPKVTAFTIPGLDLWFSSNDHLPPHFHARKAGAWEIRIFFLACAGRRLSYARKWPPGGRAPGSREKRTILRSTLEHRTELLEEWERKVATKEK